MMSNVPIFLFRRGEPIIVGHEVIAGDPDGLVVEAALKRTTGQIVPPADAPVVAAFAVSFTAAVGDDPARWFLTIPAEVSASLDPGHYAADLRFLRDGAVVAISGPAFVRLAESVCG